MSENIGLRYLYHRGLFLGDNPLLFFTRSLSLRYCFFKLAYFLLTFSMEVSIFTCLTVMPSFKTKLLWLFWSRNDLSCKIKSNNFLMWVKTSLFNDFFKASFPGLTHSSFLHHLAQLQTAPIHLQFFFCIFLQLYFFFCLWNFLLTPALAIFYISFWLVECLQYLHDRLL